VTLSRRFSVFLLVGVLAAFAHYGALIALVEGAAWRPVPATLVGYVAGGVVSYVLNRRHTFVSDRPHHEAGWRFAVVAGVGFALTMVSMFALHDMLTLHYLLAQVLTTGLVVSWSFAAHGAWTFRSRTVEG
jgi:putative flippase GtrA